MASTIVNLGTIPQYRGEYNDIPVAERKFYKDNIVTYNGSTFIVDIPFNPDNPGYVETAPYTTDMQHLNTGWAVFSSGNCTFVTGENVYELSIESTPTTGSGNLVTSGGIKNAIEATTEAAVGALETNIENGTIVAGLAGNIDSWASRDSLTVSDVWTDAVRTTAGDTSIDSTKAAKLTSIVAKTDFGATALIATGFNLLRNATAITDGYYFLVPALSFGSFGTATQPNGVLFTDSEGTNLRPTVKFKKLTDGVPTSINDGTACTYTDSNGYRFFTCLEPGYIVVTGSTAPTASTCAHIAWSRRYDEYISVSAAGDAGSTIVLASILHAVHSDVDKLLTVGSEASLVSDQIVFGTSAATWTRNVGRVAPTWTNTPNTVEPGETQTYTHSATITGMKSGGLAQFETLSTALTVDGTTISYVDESSTASADYVKYELATAVTGSVSTTSSYNVEDWGLEYFSGVTGRAFTTTSYAQNYPDSVAALLTNIDNSTIPVISEAFAYLQGEIENLRKEIHEERISLALKTIDALDYYQAGVPKVLVSSTAGAPSAAVVPDNWDESAGFWTGVPRFLGQLYIDQATTGTKVYIATKITSAVSDWVVLN